MLENCRGEETRVWTKEKVLDEAGKRIKKLREILTRKRE